MRLSLRVFVGLAAVLSAAAAFGQSTPDDKKPVQIVLYPAAEPRPALKYQLLPPFLERRPGNAAVWWNRLPAERGAFFREFEEEYSESGRIGKWMKIPLGTPQEKEYREKELAKIMYLINGRYSDMERAARFESCDWQLPFREGNAIAILLPEFQQTRTYARQLAAKAHLEIAEGKYDQAVRTFQVGYAEARQVAQGPFFVCGLIGLTISRDMNNQVQEFIQRPDAPNLYWALSTLPRPLVDLRLDGEAESNMLYLQYPELRDLDKRVFSQEELNSLLDKIPALMAQGGGSAELSRATIAALALQGYPRAKRYLIEHGRTPAEVEALPVAQVVLLYSVHVYDELNDDLFKWFFLPAAEAGDGPQRADGQLKDAIAAKREIIPLAAALLPAMVRVKEVETRGQWDLAVLRIFEAMRLYAAAHDGRWPDHLSDITDVPVPTNPFDGKPFDYHRQGDKAVLTSEKGPKVVPWRYEITLMQKAK